MMHRRNCILFVLLMLIPINTYAGVFVTHTGQKYHLKDCDTIRDSVYVQELSLNDAVKRNYTPCRVCKPGSKYVQLLEEEWQKGDPKAYTVLGEIYQYGDYGVSKNFQKAKYCYEQASKHGDPYALVRLGIMYQRGEGVTQNHKKAIELYEDSAKRGSAQAYRSIGIMYDNGFGVSINHVKAVEFYEKGLANGDVKAALSLYIAYRDGKGVKPNPAKAYEYIYMYQYVYNDTRIQHSHNVAMNQLNQEQIIKARSNAIKFIEEQ